MRDSLTPIFIHSLWRAGSTYIFNAFRRSEAGYWTYQEPVHEVALIAKTNPEVLTGVTSENLATLRHPQLERSYFYELQQTHQAWHDVIEKNIVYDDYFGTSPIEPLERYLRALITSANGRPVIQECRTSSRIGAIKRALDGIHLYLWRNPWDQWWSFKVNDYFDTACQIVLGGHSIPPVIARLKKEISYTEFHHDDIAEEFKHFDQHRLSSENSYLVFYTLWCLGLLEGITHADQMINIDSLSTSDDYRQDIANHFEVLGIPGVDFSDCQVPQAFFDISDQAFFARIENRVHGLLLASDYSQETVDNIRQIRNEHSPSTQDDPSTLVRDLHRARETALRLETTEASRGQHYHHIINNLEAQAKTLDSDLHASKSHAAHIEAQFQSSQTAASKATELLVSTKQEFSTHLQASQQERRLMEQERMKREQVLSEKTNQVRQELDSLLRTQVQREQALTTQLMTVQQQVAQEKEALSRMHREQAQALQQQHTAREIALSNQLQASQDTLHRLEQERVKRELVLSEQTIHARQELEALLRMQTQREQEMGGQLLAIHQQAAQEKEALSRMHREQAQALQQQHTAREIALNNQLQASQETLHRLEQERVKRELVLSEQTIHARQELEALLRMQTQREQEMGGQLLAIHQQAAQEKETLSRMYREQAAAIAAKLTTEIQSEQQTSLRLRQSLADVQKILATTHASLTWRMTAPLRMVASLIAPKKNLGPASPIMGETESLHATMHHVSLSQPINVQQAPTEFIMHPSAQATNPTLPTRASTLNELLAYHDQQFVHGAFLTLLGREPDSEGLNYYLCRLRAGFSKIQILAQLRLSKEGKTHAATLPGLDIAIQRHQQGQYPIIGWLFRAMNGAEGNHPTERKLRAIENRLFLLCDESNRRFNKLDIALTGLHQLVAQQAPAISTTPEVSHQTHTDAATTTPAHQSESAGLNKLSSHARDIYIQLETAIFKQAGRAT